MARWAGEPTFSGQLDLITHHRLTVWPHSPVTSPHHLHSMYQTVHRDLQISVLSCSTASLIAAGHNALSFTCCVQWTDYSMVCVYNTINTTAHSYQHTHSTFISTHTAASSQVTCPRTDADIVTTASTCSRNFTSPPQPSDVRLASTTPLIGTALEINATTYRTHRAAHNNKE